MNAASLIKQMEEESLLTYSIDDKREIESIIQRALDEERTNAHLSILLLTIPDSFSRLPISRCMAIRTKPNQPSTFYAWIVAMDHTGCFIGWHRDEERIVRGRVEWNNGMYHYLEGAL